MVGVIGGLLLAGLLGWALMGAVPGLALLCAGACIASWKLGHELRAARRAASWRTTYPSYKY